VRSRARDDEIARRADDWVDFGAVCRQAVGTLLS
jgi:hypothetical protein